VRIVVLKSEMLHIDHGFLAEDNKFRGVPIPGVAFSVEGSVEGSVEETANNSFVEGRRIFLEGTRKDRAAVADAREDGAGGILPVFASSNTG